MPDYWSNITKIKIEQTQKGIASYGQRLEEEKKLTPTEVLTYYEEELIDALMYIEHLKAKLERSIDEVNNS